MPAKVRRTSAAWAVGSYGLAAYVWTHDIGKGTARSTRY
jgi:hypothetical protein